MQESIAERKLEKRPGLNLNMSIPMASADAGGAGGGGGEHSGRSPDGHEDGAAHAHGLNGAPAVTFRVLVKKGNRQTARQLLVPEDSSLAQASRQKEAEEAREKRDIKKKVLEYNERAEDEAAPGPIQAVPPVTNHPLPPQDSLLSAAHQIGSGPRHQPGSSSRFGNANRQRRPVAAGYGRRR